VQVGVNARLGLGPRWSLRVEVTDELPVTATQANMLRLAVVTSVSW